MKHGILFSLDILHQKYFMKLVHSIEKLSEYLSTTFVSCLQYGKIP